MFEFIPGITKADVDAHRGSAPYWNICNVNSIDKSFLPVHAEAFLCVFYIL